MKMPEVVLYSSLIGIPFISNLPRVYLSSFQTFPAWTVNTCFVKDCKCPHDNVPVWVITVLNWRLDCERH
jgi:hypothetical protein